MKIRKIRHSSLEITKGDTKIVVDPGRFSGGIEEIGGVTHVLITHKHVDHIDPEMFSQVMAKNPDAMVVCNSDVSSHIRENIEGDFNIEIVEKGSTYTAGDISLKSFELKHEEIYEDVGMVQNTGYLLDDTVLLPGDSFVDPEIRPEVIAVPYTAPFLRVKDVINYGLKMKPKKIILVHDSFITENAIPFRKAIPIRLWKEEGIEVVDQVEV